MLKRTRFPLVALTVVLSLAACEDGVGTADGATQVLLASAAPASASQVPSVGELGTLHNGPGHGRMGPGDGSGPIHDLVPVEAVASVVVTLTGVEARLLRRGMGPTFGSEGWVTLEVPEGTTLDLLSLPADGLPVAAGDLEPGTYGHVRLLFSDATITFNEDVVIADSATADTLVFEAGTAYPLTIGRGSADWILVPTAEFTVTEEEGVDVVIEFDPEASIRGIAVLDDGTLVMPPVLRAWGQPFGSFRRHHGGQHGPQG